jgi:hypothetical protein
MYVWSRCLIIFCLGWLLVPVSFAMHGIRMMMRRDDDLLCNLLAALFLHASVHHHKQW